MTTTKKIIILLMIAFVTGIVFGWQVRPRNWLIIRSGTQKTDIPLPLFSPQKIEVVLTGKVWNVNIKK